VSLTGFAAVKTQTTSTNASQIDNDSRESMVLSEETATMSMLRLQANQYRCRATVYRGA
jgi:hypothetical protein